MARGLGPGGARAYTLLLEGRCRFQLSRLLAEEPFLLAAVTQLDLVPPRAEVVRQLSTGLTVNFVGLGATVVGLQATTGVLFAKSLTAAAASPFAAASACSTMPSNRFGLAGLASKRSMPMPVWKSTSASGASGSVER